ncbi:MAG TPA: hypothetical protein PLD27_08735 [bacterium]|nr:hypothetical protein [bacterium]HOL47257.1 hypothetical protein [bacterium]HPQ19293.1 hypothetical protein [bacterium]
MNNLSEKYLIPIILFITSFFLISIELLTTRIFSLIMWYHFAFVAISIALIGGGAAGLYLFFFYNFSDKNQIYKILSKKLLLTGLSIFIVYLIIFNTPIFIRGNVKDILKIAFIYFLLIIPFFFASQILIIIYRTYNELISSYYFFDLIGAASGCVAFIIFMEYIEPPTFLLIISCFFICLSILILQKKIKYPGILIILICFVFIIQLNKQTKFYDIKYIKGNIQNDLIYEKWNAMSRVAIYNVRFIDWGINQNIHYKYMPEMFTMDIDACAGMQLIKFENDKEKLEFLKYSITAIPYYLKEKPKTLIIGAGGGKDVLVAHIFDSPDIDAVEINPAIKYIVDEKFADFTGKLFSRKDLGINFILRDGRSYVRETKKKYDIIQLSLVDTWAANAGGALSLTENTLYTVEAFIDYFNKLEENGYLSITRFMFNPPNQSLRTIAIFLETCKRLNIKNPEKNIMIITSDFYPNRRVATFIFKKEEFKINEIQKLKEKAIELGFNIFYSPDEYTENYFTRLMLSNNKDEFYNNYIYNVKPTSDDNPFFFYMMKIKNIFKTKGKGFEVFNFKAVYLLVFTIIIICFFNILFIVLPMLLKFSLSNYMMTDLIPFIIYFLSIGLGFMFVEIYLIQKFILFLGHPLYSLSIVIAGLLLFTGFGSLFTKFIQQKNIKKYYFKIFIITLIIFPISYFYLFNKIIYFSLGFSQFLKYCITFFLVGIIGFFLGNFFPLGIKLISIHNQNIIQWMCALNSSASVLGSLFAYFLAMNYGFSKVALLSILIYFIAFIQIFIIFKKIVKNV